MSFEQLPLHGPEHPALAGAEIAPSPWAAHYPPGVGTDLPPLQDRTLPDMLRRASRIYAARRAFTACLPNGLAATLTFVQVDALSDDFAAYLRWELGLGPGERVAIQMPNTLAYAIAAFGILKAGCVLVNVSLLHTAEEKSRQLADCEPRALVVADLVAADLDGTALHGLDHVIVARLTEFFPSLTTAFVQSHLRFLACKIPPLRRPHTPFSRAVRAGRKARRQRGSVAALSRELSPSSLALLQYTGGTTGVIKGVMLSHGNILSSVAQSYAMMSDVVGDQDECCLSALPLFHIFGFTINLMGSYQHGTWNVLAPSPRPLANLKTAFAKYPITWMTGVNTLFDGLCREPWFQASSPRRLKASVAAGMPLRPLVAERWERITGSPIVEGYGLSEASPTLTVCPFRAGRRETVGIPLPSTEIRIVDDEGQPLAPGEPGELWARGPQIMAGYWRRQDETDQVLKDGWLATGDIAVMDPDGFVRIVDRKKDMINVSGFKVFPNEVEDCIARLAGVAEVAVIRVPDARAGEAVKAFIVRGEGVLSEQDVLAHCRKLLAAYKVPKFIEFRTELPKSPIGKILRRLLMCESG